MKKIAAAHKRRVSDELFFVRFFYIRMKLRPYRRQHHLSKPRYLRCSLLLIPGMGDLIPHRIKGDNDPPFRVLRGLRRKGASQLDSIGETYSIVFKIFRMRQRLLEEIIERRLYLCVSVQYYLSELVYFAQVFVKVFHILINVIIPGTAHRLPYLEPLDSSSSHLKQ